MRRDLGLLRQVPLGVGWANVPGWCGIESTRILDMHDCETEQDNGNEWGGTKGETKFRPGTAPKGIRMSRSCAVISLQDSEEPILSENPAVSTGHSTMPAY